MTRSKPPETQAHNWNWFVYCGVIFNICVTLALGAYSLGSQATSIQAIKETVTKHDNRWETYNTNSVNLAADIATLKTNASDIKATLLRLEASLGKK